MKLRMRMLTEEYAETMNAYLQGDAEEFIDGLIDLCVIAIGTLTYLASTPLQLGIASWMRTLVSLLVLSQVVLTLLASPI